MSGWDIVVQRGEFVCLLETFGFESGFLVVDGCGFECWHPQARLDVLVLGVVEMVQLLSKEVFELRGAGEEGVFGVEGEYVGFGSRMADFPVGFSIHRKLWY